MEELLNKLIEKGWKPFGNKKIKEAKTARWNINLLDEEVNKVSKFKDKVAFTNGVLIFDEINLRELVSKESGLWQFVCESKLIEQGKTVHDFVMKRICYADENRCGGFSMCNAEYYIMMCSLLDESELEQFLLDNIKI